MRGIKGPSEYVFLDAQSSWTAVAGGEGESNSEIEADNGDSPTDSPNHLDVVVANIESRQ